VGRAPFSPSLRRNREEHAAICRAAEDSRAVQAARRRPVSGAREVPEGTVPALQKAIRVLLLLASSGAAATVLNNAPEWVKLLFPLAATGGSLWLIFSQYGINLDSGEPAFDRIYMKGNDLSKAGTKFPNKKKHLEHWLDQAAAIAQSRYA
jgi:hypothetical protein